jgi:hypothetical protein
MSFSRRIQSLTDDYERRMRAVFRQSVQDTVNRAQRTQAEGGRMRVDTGFLRASGGAKVGGMPAGPEDADDAAETRVSQTGISIVSALAQWKPGDAVFWGWSANYARPREHIDGFQRGAAEKWDDIVRQNAQRARR